MIFFTITHINSINKLIFFYKENKYIDTICKKTFLHENIKLFCKYISGKLNFV